MNQSTLSAAHAYEQRQVDHAAVLELFINEKAIDEARRQVPFVASTEAIDSYGEIVKQNWRLERYLNNPVVLYNHQRFGDDLPIGTATVSVVSGRLECVITFVTADANPLAERVWQSVRQRSLRAVSVGFRPHDVRMEIHNDREIYILDDNELFEISVTPIGANPEALAKAKSAAREQARSQQPRVITRATEQDMDLKELQARLEQHAIDLKAAQDKLTAKDGELAAATKRADVAEARADALDSSAKELSAKLKTATDSATLAVDMLKSIDASLDEALGPIPAGTVLKTADRIAAIVKTNKDLLEKGVKAEVAALVGKKIGKAQEEKFVKLALKDRETFDEIVAGLPDLGGEGSGGLLQKQMGADPNPPPQVTVDKNAGDALANRLNSAPTEPNGGGLASRL